MENIQWAYLFDELKYIQSELQRVYDDGLLLDIKITPRNITFHISLSLTEHKSYSMTEDDIVRLADSVPSVVIAKLSPKTGA